VVFFTTKDTKTTKGRRAMPMRSNTVPASTDRAAREVVDAAFHVHRELGLGLLESAYESCMVAELVSRGIGFDRQRLLPIEYKGKTLDAGYRADLIVEKSVLVELKSVEQLQPVHRAQVLTYLKLSGLRIGILANFNVPRIKDGLIRLAL